MNQTIKTLGFVAVAAVSIVVAAGTYYSNRPVDLNDFSDVGEKFFPSFDDPNAATGLQVAAYQESTGKTELFNVSVKDGLWCIPSHHDYPADAQDKLAKTAASMVGVVRQALVERSKAAHKRYGVVDPLDKDTASEGRGDRLTLYKGNDVLVDFIVGKKLENSENLYYVRKAGEDRIYTADLGRFNVSTKFSDWIKKDVLEIARNDVKEIIVGRYHVDEVQGRVVQQGKITLTRDSANQEWKLDDLKAATEKLKSNDVNNLLSALDDLQIAGVRAKPPGLSAGLKGESESISIDPFVQRDMAEKGVFISGRGEFVYNEGKVNVGLNNGVIYELGFGEEFTGSDIDIEIGKQPSPAAEAEKLAKEIEKKPADDSKGDAKKESDKADAATEKNADETREKKSRYLFVTAYFDKALLDPEPTAPVKPEPPADKKDGDKKDSVPAEEKKEPSDKDAPKAEEKKADPKAEFEKALAEYKLQQEVYEQKKKEFDEKLKAGEKRVAELNRRFADWYYVIPEETFAQLKLKREDLVEEVKAEEQPQAEKLQMEKPKAEPAKADNKPAATPPSAAPEAEMKAKAEEKPADKPEEKPAPAVEKGRKLEPAKPEPKPEPAKPEPVKTEAAKTESVKPEPVKTEPAKTESKSEPATAPNEKPSQEKAAQPEVEAAEKAAK